MFSMFPPKSLALARSLPDGIPRCCYSVLICIHVYLRRLDETGKFALSSGLAQSLPSSIRSSSCPRE